MTILLKVICKIVIFALPILTIVVNQGCSSRYTTGESEKSGINIIPKPNKIEKQAGSFLINKNTKLYIPDDNEDLKQLADYLKNQLGGTGSERLVIESVDLDNIKATNGIFFKPLESKLKLGSEGYKLKVTTEGVYIYANDQRGFFYGIQSLRQLLPSTFEEEHLDEKSGVRIPCITIEDEPAFDWRGMHLDCCRHFMEKDFIKRYIDLIAYYKLNKLHLHLTEDQGWRLEIKKYPKLTEIGAWRKSDGDSLYGGFYTQEDMKEIIKYAEKRYVEIIPEIEMPGHCQAALAAYPQYSCTGGPFEVSTRWGVHKEVFCAGKEKTYQFLENILLEVIDLFPSDYIHIGGDEVPKDRWKACPDCQEKIREENLANEKELQSYFINRMGKFITAHGKKFIGWDEILEGGLPEGAIVQSWRGEKGGIEAANLGHKVIMSPNSHLYFNSDVEATSLKDVYHYEPIPDEISKEEQNYVLGGECCMWTEYAPQNKIDSQMFPRLLAFSEIFWHNPAKKDYSKFYQRVLNHYKRLDEMGVDYGSEAAPVSAQYRIHNNNLQVNLKPGEPGLNIYYTLDGTTPTINSNLYKDKIILNTSKSLNARAFKNKIPYGSPINKKFIKHAGFNCDVVYTNRYSEKYKGSGRKSLVNGILGSENFKDGLWQGFPKDDFEVILNLKRKKNLDSIQLNFLENINSWIFLPDKVQIYISEDGDSFDQIASFNHKTDKMKQAPDIKTYTTEFNQKAIQFIKIHAENIGKCPGWHPGAGGNAWIFVDEIIVN